MASRYHVSDSEGSEESTIRTPDEEDDNSAPSQAKSGLSHRFREPPLPTQNRSQDGSESKRIEIIVPTPSRPWEYLPLAESNKVEKVLGEIRKSNEETWYKIEYEDGREDEVSI